MKHEQITDRTVLSSMEPTDTYGWGGCDECTDYADYDDETREPPEFGCCLPPGECCMPGLHFPSECHTAADYQRRGRP